LCLNVCYGLEYGLIFESEFWVVKVLAKKN
jgi:hypothetical protein